ncbi:dihydrodipicolinate synthase family protein, partial [Escherichia coli]|nr:dihydrodipicolinate synthase family protein [Escherichia coli]
EWVHVQLHQQKGMISLSPPTICNSAIKTAISRKYGYMTPVSRNHNGQLTADQADCLDKLFGL